MDDAPRCPACGAATPPGTTPCPACGSLLAGARQVVVEPLRQEALVAYGLLESAGMHPLLTFQDESGMAHPITADEPFLDGGGLMVPVMTTFAVYVPESEADESESILADARRFEPEAEV